MFGQPMPWTTELTFEQSPTALPNAVNLVALLHEGVQSEGDVFAFMARIYSADPFYFQIWRLVNGTTDTFSLVAYHKVTPSVKEESHLHEDVRKINEWFGSPCITKHKKCMTSVGKASVLVSFVIEASYLQHIYCSFCWLFRLSCLYNYICSIQGGPKN